MISMLKKTPLILFDQSNTTGAIDVKMDGFVLEEKSFKMLGFIVSSKLDWGFYIIYIAKTASKEIGALIHSIKEIGALIHSMKFLSCEVALYLYKSTICPMYGILLSHLGWCPQFLLGIVRQAKKNGYAGLLVLHLLLLLNPRLIVKMWPL